MFKPKNSLTREKFTWGGVKPYESPSCAVTDIVVSGPLCQSIITTDDSSDLPDLGGEAW